MAPRALTVGPRACSSRGRKSSATSAGTTEALLSGGRLLVPVILGPTGVGKTDVAIRLAMELPGEVVVADSRQVYQGFDIGSNKPTQSQRQRVRMHLVDFVDPGQVFNAFEFVRVANSVITEIEGRRVTPIVEGATMLYLQALTEGFNLAAVPPRPDLRRELEGLPLALLGERLRRSDPGASVDFRNRVRLVRAVEVVETTGRPLHELRDRVEPSWRPLKIGLRLDQRSLDARLAARTRTQLAQGLALETKQGLERGVPPGAPVMTGVGASDVRQMLAGEFPEARLYDQVLASNRRLARRQLRRLRRDDGIGWFEAEPDPVPDIVNFVRSQAD